ncbi:MAG: GreA/GreB family elongation factor [Candidatus Nealsonbacteria bacterium]
MTQEKIYYLSKKGLQNLKKEYEDLKNIRILKTKGDVPSVLESEDLNPEYLSFQEDLNLLETRLIELDDVFKNVKIIKAPDKKKQNIIDVGAKVFVEINNKEKDKFEIVGTLEADPELGKISNESPVGEVLMGHKAGDKITISFPIKTSYKIKEVKY